MREKGKPDMRVGNSPHPYFNEVMENMQMLAFSFDLEGRITYCNPYFESLANYKKGELIGKNIFDTVSADKKEKLRQIFLEGIRKDQIKSHFEYPLYKKDGSIISVLWNNTLLRDENGKTTGIYCIGEDISKRKKTEEALILSEEKFQKAFHNSPDAILIVRTADGVMIEANENLFKLIGYRREEIIGNTVDSLLLWAEQEEKSLYLSRLKEEGKVIGFHARFRTKNKHIGEYIVSAELYRMGSEEYALSIIRDVSEMKRATELLDYQSMILSEMGHVAKIGGWEFDTSTGKGTWTDEVALIHDMDPGEPTDASTGLSFYSGKDKTLLENAIDKAIKEGVPYDLELQMKSAKGIHKWVHTIGKPVYDNGKIVKLRGSFQDITERKIEQENLLKSETIISTTVKFLPLILYRIDNKGDFTLSIGAGLKGLGLKPNEVVGHSAFDIYKDFPNIIDAINKGLNGEHGYFFVTIGNASYDSYLVPVKNINGEQDGIVGVAMDISKRIQVEDALRASEEKYRSIFNNIQDVFYQIKADGTIAEISPSILRFSGFTREEMIGRSVEEFYANPADREELVKRISTEKEVWDYEIKMIRKDGAIRQASLNAHLLLDENNQPIGIEGSLRDIEERKQFEADLIKEKEKAEESNKLKTAFLHNISHEIRTPMNAIIGFTQLMKEAGELNQKQKNFTAIIENSSNQLLSIIEDIVNISRIEARLVSSETTIINVNTSLEILFRQFSIKAEEQDIQFEYELSLSNPESLIRTDGTKLIQILTNLLNNAFKFTESGSIRFGYQVTDDFLEFYVSDTGIGIPEEEHSRIFNTFYQVQSLTTRLYEGTGLGLSICKAYVELLGGKIWLASEEARGTDFFFTIPYQKVNPEDLPESKKILPDPSTFRKINKILVAEDDDKNFDLIEIYLSVMNAEVIRARDGKEAVAESKKNRDLDLILMDLKMPGLDGYEALRMIRESAPKLPAIAQSAYAFDEEMAHGSGFNAFISKPFSSEALLEKIGSVFKD